MESIQEMNATEQTVVAINPASAKQPAESRNPEDLPRYSLIQRMQSTGKRVIVKQPYVSDEKNPMFAIRVDPYIPHPKGENFEYQDIVYPLPGTPYGPIDNPDTVAVKVVTYDVPPLLSLLAASHRYWTGTLIYNLRLVSSAISQGYIVTGLLRNKASTELIRGNNAHANKNTYWRQVEGASQTFHSFMAESYVQSDLSLSRHVTIEVPYNRVLNAVDTYDTQRYLTQTTDGTSPSPIPYTSDWIIVAARGSTFVGSNIEELVFEIEIAAGADFRLFRQLNIDYTTWNQPLDKPDTFPSITAKNISYWYKTTKSGKAAKLLLDKKEAERKAKFLAELKAKAEEAKANDTKKKTEAKSH